MHAGPFADAHSARGRRKQAAYVTVFGRETDRERGDDHVTRASGAIERVHEIGHDGQHEHRGKRDSRHGIERETGERRDQKSRDLPAGRNVSSGESHSKGHGLERGGEFQHEIVRESEHGKAAEPKQKTPDFDLGLRLSPPRFRPSHRRRRPRNRAVRSARPSVFTVPGMRPSIAATDGQGRSAVPWGRQEPPGQSWKRYPRVVDVRGGRPELAKRHWRHYPLIGQAAIEPLVATKASAPANESSQMRPSHSSSVFLSPDHAQADVRNERTGETP